MEPVVSDKRWKRQERRVGKALGLKRNPHDGTGNVDLGEEKDWMCAENKDRKTVPQWIIGAVADARRKARGSQLPVATITRPHSHQILVVMDLRDFRAWFGESQGTR